MNETAGGGEHSLRVRYGGFGYLLIRPTCVTVVGELL